MIQVVEDLKLALTSTDIAGLNDDLRSVLARKLSKEEGTVWVPRFPVSYIHDANRIKSDRERNYLNSAGWTDADGIVKAGATFLELDGLYQDEPALLQTMALAHCKHDADLDHLSFVPKREGDYWKRLQDADFLMTVADLDIVPAAGTTSEAIAHELERSAIGQWRVEKALRDAVRSKKENPALRQKPYLWITVVEGAESEEGHVEKMLRHYFGDNVFTGRMKGACFRLGYIGKLDDMVLRTFYKKG